MHNHKIHIFEYICMQNTVCIYCICCAHIYIYIYIYNMYIISKHPVCIHSNISTNKYIALKYNIVLSMCFNHVYDISTNTQHMLLRNCSLSKCINLYQRHSDIFPIWQKKQSPSSLPFTSCFTIHYCNPCFKKGQPIQP